MTLSDRTELRTELQKVQIASHTKQNTSAQLPFHTRLDPLKLARDPLKVTYIIYIYIALAESPRDLLKILPNGSPGMY